MQMRRLFIALFSVVCLFTASSTALACACCVNPGYYEISVLKPTSTDMSMFDEFKFDMPAQIYMSEAGFETFRGLDELRSDDEAQRSIALDITQTFKTGTWRFALESDSGRKGTLVLPMPATMVRYKVDMHDNPPNTETSLYKELRFKGNVASGTGLFRKDIVKGTSYFLVFQGRGNGCDSSADYTRWRLELNGPKATYAFYGRLN
jgi:hypothetical protein